MDARFREVVADEAELRATLGHPAQLIVDKHIHALDELCTRFIAASPFVLVASADGAGRVDVSPKGDPAGFVHVLDAHTLVIPERPGNRRGDTFCNVLQRPQVGLIFLVPGKGETLRVSGRACIVRDAWLRERLAVEGRLPAFALVVHVEEAFFHCPKCMLRSRLWQADQWGDVAGLPTLAQTSVAHARLTETVEAMQARIDRHVRDTLY